MLSVELPHLLKGAVLKAFLTIDAPVDVGLEDNGDLWEALRVLSEEVFYPLVHCLSSLFCVCLLYPVLVNYAGMIYITLIQTSIIYIILL